MKIMALRKNSLRPSSFHSTHLDSEGNYDYLKALELCFPTHKDLIKYYEGKLKKQESQLDDLVSQFEKYKAFSEKKVENERLLQEKEKETFDLKIDIAKLQDAIYESRDNYYQLATEKEKIERENLTNKRKYQVILNMSKVEDRDVTWFLENDTKNSVKMDEMIKLKEKLTKLMGDKFNKQYETLSQDVLATQISVLEKRIDDIRLLHRDEMESYKKKNEIKNADFYNERQHLVDRIKAVAFELEEAKNIINDTLAENLKLKKQMLTYEAEKMLEQTNFSKRMVCSITKGTTKGTVPGPIGTLTSMNNVKRLQQNVANLENKVAEKDLLLDEYKMQNCRLDKNFHIVKDSFNTSKKSFEKTIKGLNDRNSMLEKKMHEGDGRRKLDNEGFREDIKNLKQIISSIQRKFDRLNMNLKTPKTLTTSNSIETSATVLPIANTNTATTIATAKTKSRGTFATSTAKQNTTANTANTTKATLNSSINLKEEGMNEILEQDTTFDPGESDNDDLIVIPDSMDAMKLLLKLANTRANYLEDKIKTEGNKNKIVPKPRISRS